MSTSTPTTTEPQEPTTSVDLSSKYPQLFSGPHDGEGLLKLVLYSAAAGVAVVAIGICALRAGTEGILPGLCFGAFALALGVASLVNAFDVSDDVGELLDNLHQDAQKSEKGAEQAREAQVIKEHDSALATASNVRDHNEALGKAAAAGIRRLKFQALGNSPGVAGHGIEQGAEIVEEQAATKDTSNGHHKDKPIPLPAESEPEA